MKEYSVNLLGHSEETAYSAQLSQVQEVMSQSKMWK